MFIHRHNPLRGQDVHTPILAHVLWNVRGARDESVLYRYSRRVRNILLVLILIPIVLIWSVYNPPYNNIIADRYGMTLAYLGYALLGAIFLFPLVDIATVAFGVHSIRADTNRNIKHDLLRLSLLAPQAYLQSRLVLAQARAWRILVIMWFLRFLLFVALTVALLLGLLYLMMFDDVRFVGGSSAIFGDTFNAVDLFALTYGAAALFILCVMLLAEPLWRFRMMSLLGMSVAARVRHGAWMWFAVGCAGVGALVVQGLIAAGVVFVGVQIARAFSSWGNYSTFREMTIYLGGMVPYALMPLMVWRWQTWLGAWRWRVAQRYVFLPQGDDA